MWREILSFFNKTDTEAVMAGEFYIGESLVGDGNEIAHIDLIIGSKSGPRGSRRSPRRCRTIPMASRLSWRWSLRTFLPSPTPCSSTRSRSRAPSRRCRCSGRPRRRWHARSWTAWRSGVIDKSKANDLCILVGRVHPLAGRERQEDLRLQLPGHQGIDRSAPSRASRRSTRCCRSTRRRGTRSRAALRADRTVPLDPRFHEGRPAAGAPLVFYQTNATRKMAPPMRKLLLQLDSSRLPSVFDQVVAYDAGADARHELRWGDRGRRPRSGPWLHLHPRAQRPPQHRRLDRGEQHVGGRAAARHGSGRPLRRTSASRSCWTPTAPTPRPWPP